MPPHLADLIAGEGVDTLIGGSGGGDTFAADDGLAVGSAVDGSGTGNTLQAEGDITGASISGVQTLNGSSVTLTATQFAGFSTVDADVIAATSGTYSLAGMTAGSRASMTAIAASGTTLIGNDANGESLTASATGDDTLILGNRSNDQLTAGSGVDALQIGDGSNDIIYANSGLTPGSVINASGAAMVASGDISGATITGINVLNSSDITVSAQEMEPGAISHFYALGTIGNLYAATSGTFSLSGAIGDSAYNLTAFASTGTTLEADYSTGAQLIASQYVSDTLTASYSSEMSLDASGTTGNDTLDAFYRSGNVLNAEGSTGNDILSAGGGSGATLYAGLGNDELFGGVGSNTFYAGVSGLSLLDEADHRRRSIGA